MKTYKIKVEADKVQNKRRIKLQEKPYNSRI